MMSGVRRPKQGQVAKWVWGCAVLLVTGTFFFWGRSSPSNDTSTTGTEAHVKPLSSEAAEQSSFSDSAKSVFSDPVTSAVAGNACPDLHCKASVCECPQHICPQKRCDCWNDDRTQPIASTRSLLKPASASATHSQLIEQERAILEPDEYDELPFGAAGAICLRDLTAASSGLSEPATSIGKVQLVDLMTQFREALFAYHPLDFTVVAPQGLSDVIVLSMFQNVFPEDTYTNSFAPDDNNGNSNNDNDDNDNDDDDANKRRRMASSTSEVNKEEAATANFPTRVATAWTTELCGLNGSGTREADWLISHPPVDKTIKQKGKIVVTTKKLKEILTPPQERAFYNNVYPSAPIVHWMTENMDPKINKTERLTSVLVLPTKGFPCQYVDTRMCCPSPNSIHKVLDKRVMAGSANVQKFTIAFDGCSSSAKEKAKVHRHAETSNMLQASTVAPELNAMQATYVLALVAARANILIAPKGLPFLRLVHSLRTIRWHARDGVALDTIQEWPDIIKYPSQFTFPQPVL